MQHSHAFPTTGTGIALPAHRTPRPGGSLGGNPGPNPSPFVPGTCPQKSLLGGTDRHKPLFRRLQREGGVRGKPNGSAGGQRPGKTPRIGAGRGRMGKSPRTAARSRPRCWTQLASDGFHATTPAGDAIRPKAPTWSSGPSPVQPSPALPRTGTDIAPHPPHPASGPFPRRPSHPPPSPFVPGICPQKSLLRGTNRHKPLSPQLGGRAGPEKTARIGRRAAPGENRADRRGAGANREKSPDPEPLLAPVLDAARRRRFSRSHPSRG